MLFATVRQRKIYVKAPQTVVKDGVNVDVLKLEMDDEWAEMTSIICVFSNGSVKKEVMHTFGQPITVPWECLESTGVLMLGITGYVGTQKVMTTMNADNGWEIVQNSETTGDEQFEATPTLTQQLLEAATSANNAAEAANTAKHDILNAVSNGEFDGAPGKDGADGVGIESVVQTTTSTEDGGTNVVTVTKTDGSSSTFTVKNGSKGSDGSGGTNDHSKLINRDAADQHPIGAITGLEAALDGKQPAGSYLTDKDLDTTLTQSGKAADAKAVGDALAKISNTTTEEVTETVTVGSENVTLDSGAPSQTVNLAWNVPGGKTIPPFTNYYSNLNGKTYPRELTSGYNQFWSSSAGHGNADAFDSSHKYFMALKYELDGDSTAHFEPSSTPCITPTNSMTLSGSGWIYAFGKISNVGAASWYINSLSGTGRVYYVYCIDVTALQEAGTITATTINELAELFGGLELIPGQNYEGSTTSGTATLSITRDGETTTVDSGTATATVQGGDILSVEGGSVTFLLKVLREVYVDPIKVWAGKKWVAFGDSLTDESINADKKYYRYIEEKTGITVVVMGAGGTGYYKGYDSGTAYGQRMANVPADADVITIFGSVNDWHTKNYGVEMGNASDTMEAGTLAGYINECIDVAIEKAPYAQIALVTPMDYKGLPSDTLEGIANIIKAVAAYRQIKCLDLYHESGFRVRNPIFAAVYTTDYNETAESYGHPSNLAHEQLIAPEFMELLKRMILTV